MYCTYILFSKKLDRYYVGSTNNLERRLDEHNSGQTKSTKSGKPWELVFNKNFNTKSESIKFEIRIKKMKSKKFIERLIHKDFFTARPDRRSGRP